MTEQDVRPVDSSVVRPGVSDTVIERLKAISEEWARMCQETGQAVTLNQATESLDQK